MDILIYVISPHTKEIFPYRVNYQDNFSSILNDLNGFDLIYYNAIESFKVSTSDTIESLFPERQSQILLIATSLPLELPLYSSNPNEILLLLVSKDLSNIYPLQVPFETTLREITDYLRDNYQLSVTLTKLENGLSDDLIDSENRIDHLLPSRKHQIIFLMRDQSHLLEQFVSLGPLPTEIIINILLNLPIWDILTVCQVSTHLSTLCEGDSLLWSALVFRDFELTERVEETWKEEYQYQTTKNADQIILKAIENDDLKMAKYALHQKADHIDTDYNKFLMAAVRKGNLDIINFLIDKMHENDFNIEYCNALNQAIKSGHLHLVEILLHKKKEDGIVCNLIDPLVEAANRGHALTFQLLFSLMTKDEIQRHYVSIVASVLRGGNLPLIRLVLPPARNLPIGRKNLLLGDAAQSGNERVINLTLRTLFNPSLTLFESTDINYQHVLIGAIRGNHINLVKRILDYINNHNLNIDFTEIWDEAAVAGNKEILEILFKRADLGEISYPEVAFGVIFSRHPEVMEMVINFINQRNINVQAAVYNEFLELAIENGDVIIVKLLLDQMSKKGITPEYDQTLNRVNESINVDLIPLLLNDIRRRGIANQFKVWLQRATYRAADKGRLKILKESLKMADEVNSPLDYNWILESAVSQRDTKMMKFIREQMERKGLKLNYHNIIIDAVQSGSEKLVRDFLNEMTEKKVKVDYDNMLSAAAESGHLHLVKVIIGIMKNSHLRPDYKEIIDSLVRRTTNSEILEYILDEMDKDRVRLDYNEKIIISIGITKMLKVIINYLKKHKIKLSPIVYNLAIERAQMDEKGKAEALLEEYYSEISKG